MRSTQLQPPALPTRFKRILSRDLVYPEPKKQVLQPHEFKRFRSEGSDFSLFSDLQILKPEEFDLFVSNDLDTLLGQNSSNNTAVNNNSSNHNNLIAEQGLFQRRKSVEGFADGVFDLDRNADAATRSPLESDCGEADNNNNGFGNDSFNNNFSNSNSLISLAESNSDEKQHLRSKSPSLNFQQQQNYYHQQQQQLEIDIVPLQSRTDDLLKPSDLLKPKAMMAPAAQEFNLVDFFAQDSDVQLMFQHQEQQQQLRQQQQAFNLHYHNNLDKQAKAFKHHPCGYAMSMSPATVTAAMQQQMSMPLKRKAPSTPPQEETRPVVAPAPAKPTKPESAVDFKDIDYWYKGSMKPYTKAQRKRVLERYRYKRGRRNFKRRVRYQCRRRFAVSRPRVGGRFVKLHS